MAGKRTWFKWPGRIAQELNGVSGIAAIGGTAIGAGGLTFLAGTAAVLMTGGGALVLAGAVGYAVVKGLPARATHAQDLAGQQLRLVQLENIDPPIRTLAVIGPELAGKTTLKNRLAFIGSKPTRTQQITAYITPLPATPVKYIAILDGGGEVFSQQFRIAELCDCLCIVLDHNPSDSDHTIIPTRLSQHKAFLEQVRHHLDNTNASQKLKIKLLINKHDLWKLDTADRQAQLRDLCEGELKIWRDSKRGGEIDFSPHSNNIPLDVANFVEFLKGLP